MIYDPPSETKQAIIKDYQSGVLWKDMEAKYGEKEPHLLKALKQWGIPIQGNKRQGHLVQRGITDQQVKAKYEELGEADSVASFFGVSSFCIRKVIKRMGLSSRQRQRGEFIEEQRRCICELYDDGHSMPKIAAQIGISKSSVWNVLSTSGVLRGKGRERERLKDDLIKLYLEERWTLEEIADAYDMWVGTLAATFDRWGVIKRLGCGNSSRLESRFYEDFIQPLNIECVRQYKIDTRLFDFFLPTHNLIIEVNGDYWHGNPKKFKRRNSQQKEALKRDRIKKSLALASHHRIIYIWEDDIKNHPDKVRKTLMKNISIKAIS